MKTSLILSLFGLGIIGFSCQQGAQAPSYQQPTAEDQPYEEYSNWRGPGWYYGVWFYNENDYTVWRGKRRGRYRQRDRYYYRTYPRKYYHPQRGRGRGRGRR